MRILSIETSADETGVSVVTATGDFPDATYDINGDALFSQTDLHNEYGGIYPMMAKREHAKTLPLMLHKALRNAGLLAEESRSLSQETVEALTVLLQREPELTEALINFFSTYKKPDVDIIGVTTGPGLEPTLWVGINFAKALALVWDLPIVPVNHMEGHLLVSLYDGERMPVVTFPALGLLISGGHTEIDLMENWGDYSRIGETRDDAIGEAFDKVARLLGLPYPGGPEISKLANSARQEHSDEEPFVTLPRPMLNSGDLDFSFSGIKTAVRYAVEDKELSDKDKQSIALEFETAVTEVLIHKMKAAVEEHGARAIIIGGGVSANQYIRDEFTRVFSLEYPDVTLYIPERAQATDNAIMIALAAHAHKNSLYKSTEDIESIKADGNKELDN